MKISIDNILQINEEKLDSILSFYGISNTDYLGKGTECIVYQLNDYVLKIYSNLKSFEELNILKNLYENLDYSHLTFTIPKIIEINRNDEHLCVIEEKIIGKSLEELLEAKILDRNLDSIKELYINTILDVQKIHLKYEPSSYLLFDQSNESNISKSSWSEFLFKMIDRSIKANESILLEDILNYKNKIKILESQLSNLKYNRPLRLIHGDLFPGNLIIKFNNKKPQVSGLIDFGSFTMFGDPDYEIATACAFYDMYSEASDILREDLFQKGLNQADKVRISKIYLYLMCYAILSCDLYTNKDNTVRTNGHYKWCVKLLNENKYWVGI